MKKKVVKKKYVDALHGQIHGRIWGNAGAVGLPLVCLPPAPYSGAAYDTLAPMLAERQQVVALDYPGYGNSDPTPNPPEIEDYALAAATFSESIGSKVNLLGFHSGCLVAIETALAYPDQVEQLILVDVPYFEPERRKELLLTNGVAKPLPADLSELQEAWKFCVTNRLDYIPLERAYAMFVDQISSGASVHLAFRAAFNYAAENRLPKLQHTCSVIATSAGLYQQSLDAAALIPNARLIELTEIKIAVLEQGAETVAQTIAELLSS